MPCRRLAVKDAGGAAQRAKLLDGEWHGHQGTILSAGIVMLLVVGTRREEVHGQLVGVIAAQAWPGIRFSKLDHALLAAAESGGWEAVGALLNTGSPAFALAA
jgi:hypothetical protein